MSTDADANAGTTAVRDAYRFDEARLAAWLADNIAGYAGPLTVEQFKGGQSNPTYKLFTPSRSYVLRRKPPGVLLKGAHAVEREARVLSALAPTGFSVAKVYGLCTDDSVIGSWFFVMEMVEGRIFWDATFLGMERKERAAYFDAMNETIAALHRIDPDVRLHDLRHSFASIAIADGISLMHMGGLLGHALPDTTARYAHLADDVVADAAARVSGSIARCLGVAA